MKYKIVIPARANSKRLPGKNMKLLDKKPLIEYSIDFALNNFSKNDIWVNSDDIEIIKFSKSKGVKYLSRPKYLASDLTTTVDVLKFQLNFFNDNNIKCDSIILLQPTNPFRKNELLSSSIKLFESSNRDSLATFSLNEKKIGKINNNYFKPNNYSPGQRSQDLEKTYYENGLLYITKRESIIKGKIITEDVYPVVCNEIESKVDIDNLEDFIFAESLLKARKKNEKK